MERIDDLRLKGLKIIQDTELFCFGTDAVLLAGFTGIPKNASVVDLGTGTGILPLLLYGRYPHARYRAVEIQERLVENARRSVELNGLDGQMEIVHGDIREAHKYFGNANDVVVANPPYEKVGDGAARETDSHKIARKEVAVTFGELAAAAARLLKTGGRFCLIHKASRLPELFYELKQAGLEPKVLRLVQPYAGAEPRYALIQAVKGGREFLKVLPTLALHNEDGSRTTELKTIYGE